MDDVQVFVEALQLIAHLVGVEVAHQLLKLLIYRPVVHLLLHNRVPAVPLSSRNLCRFTFIFQLIVELTPQRLLV